MVAAAEKNPNAHHHITQRKYTEAGAGQDCVDREVLSPYVGDRGYRDIKTPSSRPGNCRHVISYHMLSNVVTTFYLQSLLSPRFWGVI